MSSRLDRRPDADAVERLAREVEGLREANTANQRLMQHEIAIYRQELTVQNQALVTARSALENSRDRFVEMYDYAPNGYVTLDKDGLILLCNLTAAILFGRSKSELEEMPLSGFVVDADRPRVIEFLRLCGSGIRADVECEFAITTPEGSRDVQILCRPTMRPVPESGEFFVSMVDVTHRKQLERGREQAAREYAALATRLLSAQEDERQRIARNLHDDLGQELTALRLKVEELGAAVPECATSEVFERLRQMLLRLDQRMHLVASELRPSELDLGIVPAIEQFVREWRGRVGVAVECYCDAIEGHWLAPETETHMYRILQEALNNVAKHAGAARVTVSLRREDGGATLVITDDGAGFDDDSIERPEQGLGLVGIRERVHLLGGRIDIDSRAGHGTTLRVFAPAARLNSR